MNKVRLPCNGEWTPRFRGWYVLQFTSGFGYFWQQSNAVREVAEESVLVLGGESGGSFRASQLNPVMISYFCIKPEKLGGILTLSEQIALEKAARCHRLSAQMLPPTDPVSIRLKNIWAGRRGADALARLQMLELFIGLFECEIKEEPVPSPEGTDGRNRLRQLLAQMPAEELTELSLPDLASRMRCSVRHLSRLFREEVGASFRDKQTELRLAKACELLATSNAKVVDVALTSGYQSNSLFSLLFKNHFGLTPGQWRQRHGANGPRQRPNRMLPV